MSTITIIYETEELNIPEWIKLEVETKLPKQISVSGYVLKNQVQISLDRFSSSNVETLSIDNKFNNVFIPEYLFGKRKFCFGQRKFGIERIDLVITKEFDIYGDVITLSKTKNVLSSKLNIGVCEEVKQFIEYFDKYTFEMFVTNFSDQHPHSFPIKGCLTMVSENCDTLSRKDLEEICIERLTNYSVQNKLNETHEYNLKEIVRQGVEVFYTHFKNKA